MADIAHRFLFFHPAFPIILPFSRFTFGCKENRIVRVDHNSILIGMSFFALVRESFWMRAVVYPARMKSHHPRLNVLPADEVPFMIKNKFIGVGVAVKEGDLQCIRLFFDRTRDETAYDRSRRHE